MKYVYSDTVDLNSSTFASWICWLGSNLVAIVYILFFV